MSKRRRLWKVVLYWGDGSYKQTPYKPETEAAAYRQVQDGLYGWHGAAHPAYACVLVDERDDQGYRLHERIEHDGSEW